MGPNLQSVRGRVDWWWVILAAFACRCRCQQGSTNASKTSRFKIPGWVAALIRVVFGIFSEGHRIFAPARTNSRSWRKSRMRGERTGRRELLRLDNELGRYNSHEGRQVDKGPAVVSLRSILLLDYISSPSNVITLSLLLCLKWVFCSSMCTTKFQPPKPAITPARLPPSNYYKTCTANRGRQELSPSLTSTRLFLLAALCLHTSFPLNASSKKEYSST